ncbi:MAG TPA: proton-conducting transporter membrane subunit [Candidatus Dormibacteraeota bacterium]
MSLAILAAAARGPLDTWSPTVLALVTLLLPLIAVLLILSFTIDSRRASAAVSVLFTLASAVSALLLVSIEGVHPLHLERNATFLQFFTGQSGAAAEFRLEWGVTADPLAAIMLITVAVISLLVQVYALGSIRRDDGVVRFFSVLLFSTFAMFGVVLSTNYFELFFFWALVSVSSYLLIAHWWQREEAVASAAKAFWVSAVGDVGLLIGIVYIFFRFNELNFQTLASQYTGGKVGANGLFLMALLVFVGAAARSAQFPLHVWLPGSAQAPAPAAALIHSAGIALCGVYLVARSYALFHASPRALLVVAIVGALSALLGATWSLFQDNLKRAIAYGTMSELGLMMLALGIGAYGAGVFDLFTHAWPKALLLLGAGVLIREMRTERMAEMGGLWGRMRFTGVLMLIATAAAAGIPPLSTFWSKDAILSRALALGNPAWVLVVIATIFLSGLYLFRIYALVFLGQTARRRRFEPERIRDASGRLAMAMVVLAIPSVVSGIRVIPGRTDFLRFVTFPGLQLSNSHFLAAGITLVAGVLGAAAALLIYGRRLGALGPSLEPMRQALRHGFYLDRGYALGMGRGVLPASQAAGWVDRAVIDGALDLAGDSVAYASASQRRLPRVRPQHYALGLLVGLLALAAASFALGGHR